MLKHSLFGTEVGGNTREALVKSKKEMPVWNEERKTSKVWQGVREGERGGGGLACDHLDRSRGLQLGWEGWGKTGKGKASIKTLYLEKG